MSTIFLPAASRGASPGTALAASPVATGEPAPANDRRPAGTESACGQPIV